MPSPWVSAALNRCALRSSFTNRAFGQKLTHCGLPSRRSVLETLIAMRSPGGPRSGRHPRSAASSQSPHPRWFQSVAAAHGSETLCGTGDSRGGFRFEHRRGDGAWASLREGRAGHRPGWTHPRTESHSSPAVARGAKPGSPAAAIAARPPFRMARRWMGIGVFTRASTSASVP